MFEPCDELGYGLNCEVLILWDRDVADVLPIDLLFLATDEIFQKVDRHLFYKNCSGRSISRIKMKKFEVLTICWELNPTVHSTEVVALSFATVLGSEGRG